MLFGGGKPETLHNKRTNAGNGSTTHLCCWAQPARPVCGGRTAVAQAPRPRLVYAQPDFQYAELPTILFYWKLWKERGGWAACLLFCEMPGPAVAELLSLHPFAGCDGLCICEGLAVSSYTLGSMWYISTHYPRDRSAQEREPEQKETASQTTPPWMFGEFDTQRPTIQGYEIPAPD